MVDLQPAQTNFTAGELSPRLYGRRDLARYDNGAGTLLNAIIQPHGGVTRRPGTRFVAQTKDADNPVRLAPFRFNQAQAYILEFGDRYVRFYRNAGQVTGPDMNGATVTNGDFTSDIAGWTNNSTGGASIAHDATNGRLSLVGSGSDAAAASQQVTSANTSVNDALVSFDVIGAPGDRVGLSSGALGGFAFLRNVGVGHHVVAVPASSGPPANDFHIHFAHSLGKTLQVDNVAVLDNVPVELATPYAAADVFGLKIAQSADTLYIAHPDYPPHKLLRYGDDEWSLERVYFTDGPYLDENSSSKTMTPAATSGGNVQITSQENLFAASDVGRSIRLKHGATWGWGVIVSVTSSTVARVDIKSNFGGTGGVTAWRLGAWGEIDTAPAVDQVPASEYLAVGYPACVTFHEQRLCWAGEKNSPQMFRTSKSGDFENMAPTTTDGAVEDDAALNYRIGADQANAILWLQSQRSLVLGTQGGTWPVRASSLDEPLTPTNIQFKRANTYGSADVQPVTAGDVTLYLSPTGRKLRELAYLFERDNFAAPDLSILSEHITAGGVVQMDFAQEPHGLVVMCRGDGTLLAMTYNREHEVIGWQRHLLGGGYQGGFARWESVAVIPAPDQTHDQIWGVAARTINGSDVRCVEVMARDFDANGDDDISDAFFVDCGLSYDDPKAITGATRANPVVLTVAGHGFANGDLVDVADVAGMTALNGNRYTVASAAADSFALEGVDGSGFAAYGSGGVVRKAVTVITGADHLNGAAVDVVADGVHLGTKTPSVGSITLATPASRVHAGFGYVTDVVTLPIAARTPDGSGEGKTKRIGDVVVRFHRTSGAKTGPDFATLDRVPFDDGAPPYSGIKIVGFPAGYDVEGVVALRQDAPLPMTILSLSPRVNLASR